MRELLRRRSRPLVLECLRRRGECRACRPISGVRDVGIDLGLEDLIATSDGEKVSAPQFYRGLEPKLAIAQRAGKKDRVRAIHAKIANRRKDSLHQFSTRLVRGYDIDICRKRKCLRARKDTARQVGARCGLVGVSTMLRYKCDFAGATFAEVDEAFSTQTCSACDSRSGPKGIAGLGIRVWTCSDAERSTTATSTPQRTSSRRDVAVLQKESPLFQGAGGRQPQTVTELTDAVAREHLAVNEFFMMHVGLTPWSELSKAVAAAELHDTPDGVL